MKITPDVITARQNPLVKWAATLADKKGRDVAGCFLAEGEKLTFEAAEQKMPVERIFLSEKAAERLLPELKRAFSEKEFDSTILTVVGEDAFAKIATEKAPEGVICVIKYLDFSKRTDIIYKEDFLISSENRQLFLASLRDPGNLGAVMRSAVAFGVDTLVMSADCVDPFNPKVVRSAMGALFKLHLVSLTDTASYLRALRAAGRQVYAAELTDNAVPLGSVSLNRRDVFMIGNEGHGIPRELSALATASVYIPIAPNTESLNASVAASILLWEQSK